MMFVLVDSIRLDPWMVILDEKHRFAWLRTHGRTDNGRVLTSVYNRRRWGGGEKITIRNELAPRELH